MIVVAIVLAAGCASVPTPDKCSADKRNHFENAAVVPGAKALQLAQKLSSVNDYGNHPTGWLSQRLFALDDDVEISGEIVSKSDCIRHVTEDNDREFYVTLSDLSYRMISAYFDPPQAAPHTILVEIVASLSPAPNTAVPFKTWRANADLDKVQFSIDNLPPHAMVSTDDGDWGMLKSGRFRYASVRGALVVDTSDFHAGSGDLEIHPAEAIRLSSAPLQ